MKKANLFKRILSISLCSVMAAGMFSACGNSGNEASGTGSQASSQSSGSSEKDSLYIEGSEGVTLTYWIPMGELESQNFTSLAEHPYFIWLKEQTGVNVEFIHPSWEQQSAQLNLMLASHNLYDMLFSPNYPGGPQVAIDDNCFIDLGPYLDEYMPDYKAALTCDDGSFGAWEWGDERELYQPTPLSRSFQQSCTTASGAIWCATQLWTDAFPTSYGPVIRKDWLDEAGLDVPETLDELEVVLEAFKARGENITPMSLGSTGANTESGAIISAFDIYSGYFTMSDNKTKVEPFAYVTDAFRDYLTLMNKWYEKGYIDVDFMNRDEASLTAMFLDDRLGIYMDNSMTPEAWEYTYVGEQDFEVVAMPLPRKDKNQQLKYLNTYDIAPTSYTVITSACEYPEIAAAWLNVGFTKEGILRAYYGIEGEHYELRDGVPYFLDKVYASDFDSEYFGSCVRYGSGSGYQSIRSIYALERSDWSTTLTPFAEASKAWSQNASPEMNWTYTVFSDDNWGVYDDAFNNAATYASPLVLKFIIGEESLDNFEEFRDTAKSLGFDEAQEVAQEARDVMLGK